MKDKLLEEHIRLVERVNESTTTNDHCNARNQLHGFRKALRIMGINQFSECDQHYIDKGITDRPIVAGVFADWQPTMVE